MTDGIIQEVFKPYIRNWSFDSHSRVIQNEFIKLQQELIEKISLNLNCIFDSESCNEAHFDYGFNLFEVGKNVRHTLIGDKQE